MRFGTSCFKTLVRSDLRHYWPLGCVYIGIWIIGLPISVWNAAMGYGTTAQKMSDVANTAYHMQFMGLIMAAIFGVLMAMAVYSYLMTARSVGLHHSLPATRTTQFFAHFTSGMGLLLFGNVVTVALTLLVEAVTGFVAVKPLLWWLLMVSLLDFAFFTLGIFCAMFTGWVLAVPAIYVGVNFAAAAIEALLQGMAGEFYFGFDGSVSLSPVGYWLTPIIKVGQKLQNNRWANVSDGVSGRILRMDMEVVKIVVIYAVLALVLLGISFLLYRLRHSEYADDPVAFRWARPIFRYAIALVGGIALGMGVYDLIMVGHRSFPVLVLCLLVMASLCYIAAEMIIRKSFRVFKGGWKGLAALCAVLVLVCVGMKLDVFGSQTYVPEADEVKEIHYISSGDSTAFSVTDSAEQETIAAAIAMHEAILAQGLDQECDEEDFGSNTVPCGVYLTYTMQNGREVTRHYNVGVERGSALHKAANALAGTKAVRTVTLLGDTPLKVEDIYGGYVSCYWENDESYDESLSEQKAQELYAALLRDVEQGHGKVDIVDDQDCVVEMSFDTERMDARVGTLTPDCTETIAVLLKMGVAEKAEDLFNYSIK